MVHFTLPGSESAAPQASEAAVSLVRGMLRRTGGWGVPSDPHVRLGAFDLGELEDHPFFEARRRRRRSPKRSKASA